MAQIIAISKDTIQLAWDLREAIWEHLKEQLNLQQLDEVMDYEALYIYAGKVSGSIDTNEFGREDAPRSLVDTLASVLHWLPRKHWPDRLVRYAEDGPLALEALQAYAWKAGIEDRRPPAEDAPGALEQLAARVVLEDDAEGRAFAEGTMAQMDVAGLSYSERFDAIADIFEHILADNPHLSDERRAETVARIAWMREQARKLRE